MGKPNIEELEQRGDVYGLIKAIRDKDEAIVEQASEALVGMGETAVKPLIDGLSETVQTVIEVQATFEEVAVSWPTATPLVRIGEPAVEPLIQVLKSYTEQGSQAATRRRGAAVVLGHIGDKRAVKILAKLLEKSKSPKIKSKAAWALGRLGRTVEAIEGLREGDWPNIPASMTKELHNDGVKALTQLGLIKAA